MKTRTRPFLPVAIIIFLLGYGVATYAHPDDRRDEVAGRTISYSGYLEDGGRPVADSNVDLAFELYASTSSAMPLWAGATRAPVRAGRFVVELGGQGMPSLPEAAFTQPEVFVRVAVNGTSLAGYQRIGTARHAVHAAHAAHATEADNGAPSGTIVAFAGHVAPDGWVLCDGRALSSSSSNNLFLAIQTVWGDGSSDDDPATDFNVPDLRGMFLRGLGEDGTVDGSRELGTLQDWATGAPRTPFTYTAPSAPRSGLQGGGSAVYIRDRGTAVVGGGDTETRPINIAVNYIIKL